MLPENKIMMGIPNFGFDWELPFDNGITRARTFGDYLLEFNVASSRELPTAIKFIFQ